MNAGTSERPLILFDGVCKFCNASVQFVIRHDSRQRFRFCPIQSDTGKRIMAQYGLQDSGLTSMILVQDHKTYRKSAAALRIARQLDFPWPLLYAFIALPRPVRDAMYDFVGKRRYRWFGKLNECSMPDENVKNRYLD